MRRLMDAMTETDRRDHTLAYLLEACRREELAMVC